LPCAHTADPHDMVLAAKAYAQSGDRDNFLRVVDAYPLAYRLVVGEGLENLMPEAQQWFERALDLSGPDRPVQQFELKNLLSSSVTRSRAGSTRPMTAGPSSR
jgi:hypothetical protein